MGDRDWRSGQGAHGRRGGNGPPPPQLPLSGRTMPYHAPPMGQPQGPPPLQLRQGLRPWGDAPDHAPGDGSRTGWQGGQAGVPPGSSHMTGSKRRFAEEPPRHDPGVYSRVPPPVTSAAPAPAWSDGSYPNRSDPYHQYYSGRVGGAQPGTITGSWENDAHSRQLPQGTVGLGQNLSSGRGGGAPQNLAPPTSSSARPPSLGVMLVGGTSHKGQQPGGTAGAGVLRGQQQQDDGWEFLALRPSTAAPLYTRLTQNIASVVRRLDPTPEELQRRHHVLHAVSLAVASTFPEYKGIARVKAFGSFVSGLGTKDSDIDLVITGIQEPDIDVGFYQPNERQPIARMLDRVSSALYRQPELRGEVKKHFVIRNARMPVARITLTCGLVIDLSVGSAAGPQVSTWPSLRPLVLTIKAYMKEQGLNDVSAGGLSSYGLTYMVLAHLQEEAKAGADTKDLGLMLCRFFRRYGGQYDPCQYVVAVGMGGVVKRKMAERQGSEYFKNNDRLATVDPLTGRDCTEGCYETQQVLSGLDRADVYLAAVVDKYEKCDLRSLEGLELLDGLMAPPQQGWGHEDEDGDYNPAFKRRR